MGLEGGAGCCGSAGVVVCDGCVVGRMVVVVHRS